jgi:hypothetical protein
MTITRRELAVWFVFGGLLIGFLGNVFFYGNAVGLNWPLFVAVLVIAVLAMRWWLAQPFRARALWPVLPMLFFALMVAVRADPILTSLNIAATLALGGMVLYYLPVDRCMDEDALTMQLSGAIVTLFAALFGPMYELGDAGEWVKHHRPAPGKRAGSVMRGLAIAVPVVLVFALLMGAADAVFADYIKQFFSLFSIKGSDELIGRAIVTLMIGWVAVGLLGYGVVRRKASDERARDDTIRFGEVPPWIVDDLSDAEPGEAKQKQGDGLLIKVENPETPTFRLGIIEAGIVLTCVDLLFAAFVVVQFAYFFGGRENIKVDGLTYAEYARRGFFELVAIAVMVLGLSLWLDHVTERRDAGREQTVFRALAVLLIALTVVVLVSAARRMALYEDAYGFTRLRVYTHVFMPWLGVTLGAFVLSLFRVREHIFSLGLLIAAIGCLATLNVMNVDGYIASRNIARYRDGAELDTVYLQTLSLDAVPAVVDLYDDEGENQLKGWLAEQLYELDQLRDGAGKSVFAANAGRQRAWDLLDPLRDSLPAYQSPARSDW